jgi:hypothetical protein
METFKDPEKKKRFNYLKFLPKELRQMGLYSVISNMVTVFLSLISFPGMQKEIPLFYSQAEDQILVEKTYILILPLIALFINFLHLGFIKINRDFSLSILRVIIRVTLFLELLTLAILLRIILITR